MMQINLILRNNPQTLEKAAKKLQSPKTQRAFASFHATLSTPTTSSTSSSSLLFPKFSNNGVVQLQSKHIIQKSLLSTENLVSILNREKKEEEEEGNNVIPSELQDLKTQVENDWRIVENESNACVTLYKKDLNENGMKVALNFHCQDTVDPTVDEAEEETLEEENDDEESTGIRFILSCNKAGKNVVIGCVVSPGGVADVESVTVRDGDTVDEGFMLRGTENFYQGPEFFELATDLQSSFNDFVQDECGIDENVSAFISMYADYKEQTEYTKWLSTLEKIL